MFPEGITTETVDVWCAYTHGNTGVVETTKNSSALFKHSAH